MFFAFLENIACACSCLYRGVCVCIYTLVLHMCPVKISHGYGSSDAINFKLEGPEKSSTRLACMDSKS